MDYITLNGIRDRTGFDIEDLYQFVIKELLDNAIDELEKKYAANTPTTMMKKANFFIKGEQEHVRHVSWRR